MSTDPSSERPIDRLRALERDPRPTGLDRIGRLERRVRHLEVIAALIAGFLIGRNVRP